jgi:hypothetical protein
MIWLERPCESRSRNPIARYFRRPPVRFTLRSRKQRMSDEDQADCIGSPGSTTSLEIGIRLINSDPEIAVIDPGKNLPSLDLLVVTDEHAGDVA